MNKKLLALILILLTIVIGAAAVYVGMKLSEGPTTPTDTNAYTYSGIRYQYYCPAGRVVEENGTVCLYVSNYNGSYISKHWCDTATWLNDGCNCPSSATCDQSHQMADGSTNQQGLYSPNTSSCECSDGAQSSGLQQCSDVKTNASVDCGINLFRQAPFVTKICLDRVPGDRAQTYCGLQQIDWKGNNCFLSGLMTDTDECQAQATETPTTTPSETPTGTPSVTPSLTLSPTVTITGTLPATVTPSASPSITATSTVTPTVTRTPSVTPTASPSITITPSKTTAPTLPPTAIVTDEVDRMIIGFLLLFVGFALYKSGLYINLGNMLWSNGGASLWGGISGTKKNTWSALIEVDSNIEGFFITVFKKMQIASKLVVDNLTIVLLSIANLFLSIALVIVKGFKKILRFFKKIARFIKTISSIRLRKREKQMSFEETLIKSTAKKRK